MPEINPESTPSIDTTALARVVREARRARGWSLREAARQAELNPMVLSRLERGELKQPSPHALYQMGRAFDLPYADLMRLAGYAAPVDAREDRGNDDTRDRSGSASERLLLRAAAPFTEDELEAMLAFLRYYRQQTSNRASSSPSTRVRSTGAEHDDDAPTSDESGREAQR